VTGKKGKKRGEKNERKRKREGMGNEFPNSHFWLRHWCLLQNVFAKYIGGKIYAVM